MALAKFLAALLVGGLLSGCSDDGVTENLSNLSAALTIPQAGGTRAVAAIGPNLIREASSPIRATSTAGCQTINASVLFSSVAVLPRLTLCMFGAMEEVGLITRPSGNSSYNYYSFDSSRITGRRTGAFKIRYGNDASGNLLVNTCQDDSSRFEMSVSNADSQSTVTITDQYDFSSASLTGALFQMVVTAERGSDAYSFQSASMNMSDSRSASGFFSLTKGADATTFTQRLTISEESTILHTQWDSSQGAAKIQIAGGTSFAEAFENDSDYTCVEPQSSGTFFSAVSETDLAEISSAETPSFADQWDCEAAGGNFETPNIATNTDLTQEVLNCPSTFTIGTWNSCGSSQSCS